jgi:hypothetical protein
MAPHANGANSGSNGSNGTPATKPFLLNAFVMNCPSHLSAGLWKHPRSGSARYKKLDFWVDLAKLLDDAGFHAMFVADVLGPYVSVSPFQILPVELYAND